MSPSPQPSPIKGEGVLRRVQDARIGAVNVTLTLPSPIKGEGVLRRVQDGGEMDNLDDIGHRV